ncbi:MAG: hypothetical protein ACQER0_08900 [Bacillota bacterium]
MKFLKILFLLCLIMLISINVFALELEVESQLNDFVQSNLLVELEKENLKNPFFIKKEKVESDFKKNLDLGLKANQKESKIITENKEQQVDEQKNNYNPEIKINGVLRSSNSKLALLVNYKNQSEIIKIGESLDSYKLISYQAGEATFINQGEKFKVIY